MKRISRLFLQGLLAILPIAVTLSILFWLGTMAESTLGKLLKWLFPDNWYWPGMGLAAGVIFVIAVGILLNAYVFRKLANLTEHLLKQIPFVNTIYNSISDIAKFVSASQRSEELKNAVAVQINEDIQLIGFVTRTDFNLAGRDNLMAVYLPMSYQIGGYTALLPKSRLTMLDISVQDAMRLVLTAAMTYPDQTEEIKN